MFFETLSRKNTDSVLLLLNILEILTVSRVYCRHALKLTLYMYGTKVFCQNSLTIFFQYASNVHNYNTRYPANQNLHIFRVKTNTGKQMISFMAIDLWKEIPIQTSLKI